jgi:hypothetical protein
MAATRKTAAAQAVDGCACDALELVIAGVPSAERTRARQVLGGGTVTGPCDMLVRNRLAGQLGGARRLLDLLERRPAAEVERPLQRVIAA